LIREKWKIFVFLKYFKKGENKKEKIKRRKEEEANFNREMRTEE